MGIQDADVSNVDITSTGAVAGTTLQPTGRARISTIVSAGSSIDVAIQVREKGGTWRTQHTFSAVTSVQDNREVAAYEVRLNITSAATSGTGDFYFAAGD